MKCYVVDAFAEKCFAGNPAAVLILDQPISEKLMQNIAMENNLSETAFAVKTGGAYHLRWFTPGGEINLCGHATLATAYVLANFYAKEDEFRFDTLSGRLTVTKEGDMFELDFPAIATREYAITDDVAAALGANPLEAFIGRDPVFIFGSEEEVRELSPDFSKLLAFPDGLGVFVTSKSERYDFVTRAFWPKMGVNEDPVCGAMYCSLTPIWAKRLGKTTLVARQLSKRGGTVYTQDCGDRVKIKGPAVLYSIAELQIG